MVGFDSAPNLIQGFKSGTDIAGAALRDLKPGDKGAANLDGIKFSVDLLRKQPAGYRRAILLISEANDHGSATTRDDALRAIGDTNTAIYSLGFSTAKAEAQHYGSKVLPMAAGGPGLENPNPNPPHGCMGRDPDPDATHNKFVRAYDCLTQLAPPQALAEMAAIAATECLQRSVPERVAQLTGGEYFRFEDNKSLIRGLVTISNHVPNRYLLSFQPQSPHPGFHAIELKLRDYPELRVTTRSGYWADSETAPAHHP
jgi:VWFA-related protein